MIPIVASQVKSIASKNKKKHEAQPNILRKIFFLKIKPNNNKIIRTAKIK
jgi:hypothetical protein